MASDCMGYTRHLTVERAAPILPTMLTPGAAQAFGHEHVTIPIPARLLPKSNKDLHNNSKLIYAIIGEHDDGRWASYPGSPSKPGPRIEMHKRQIAAVGRETPLQGCQEVPVSRVGPSKSVSYARWTQPRHVFGRSGSRRCRSSVCNLRKRRREAITRILMSPFSRHHLSRCPKWAPD